MMAKPTQPAKPNDVVPFTRALRDFIRVHAALYIEVDQVLDEPPSPEMTDAALAVMAEMAREQRAVAR
jgi:hypothetical protein